MNWHNRNRVTHIYDMLAALAEGNYAHQIQATRKTDALEDATAMLNEVAHRLCVVLEDLDAADRPLLYRKVTQPLLIVERNVKLYNFCSSLALRLGYTDDAFKQLDLSDLLTPQSHQFYVALQEPWKDNPMQPLPITLVFISASKEFVPWHCTLNRLHQSDSVIISGLSTQYIPSQNPFFSSKKNTDAEKIQALYEYIVHYLDQPLPSTPMLAVKFKMNAFKLKHEFKQTFGTSIYQLYTDERLKRARTLITTTSLPFKIIALESGFTTYLNFYKAFRKKYGCTPTELPRETPLE